MSSEDESRWPIQIDPPGCGCTECIIGQYVPLDRATDRQIAAMLHGVLGNAVGSGLKVAVTARVEFWGYAREIDPAVLGILYTNDSDGN